MTIAKADVLRHSSLASLGRAQLRTCGMALPSQDVPWERIGSYELHDGTTHTEVAIRSRTRLTFSGYPWELTLGCPTDRRQALEAIMGAHLELGEVARANTATGTEAAGDRNGYGETCLVQPSRAAS